MKIASQNRHQILNKGSLDAPDGYRIVAGSEFPRNQNQGSIVAPSERGVEECVEPRHESTGNDPAIEIIPMKYRPSFVGLAEYAVINPRRDQGPVCNLNFVSFPVKIFGRVTHKFLFLVLGLEVGNI